MNKELAIECIKTQRQFVDDLTKEAFDVAIDLLKQPQRTGRWIPQDHNKSNGMVSTAVFYYPKCSECGHSGNYDMNFCPNCGARMEGE